MPRIGVLSLQGDFAAHARVLARLGAQVDAVRTPGAIPELDGLALPGGESTALLHLMEDGPWFETLRGFHARGGAFLATCAGAILLAREVVGPAQRSVGVLDATIERNAHGRQVDSFETDLAIEGRDRALRALFIRAPRFRSVGPRVEVLARLDGEPVLVRQGRVLAACFHTELGGDDWLHESFLALARDARTSRGTGGAGVSPRRVAR
jgi:5'-phosphate synthase pdxT subunit